MDSDTVEEDDPLEIVATEEPQDAGGTGMVADAAGASGSDPAVLELTIPGHSPGTGDTEVTVPLNIRLNHKGEPLELRFSLTLRLED